jgi:hypothetical protein
MDGLHAGEKDEEESRTKVGEDAGTDQLPFLAVVS